MIKVDDGRVITEKIGFLCAKPFQHNAQNTWELNNCEGTRQLGVEGPTMGSPWWPPRVVMPTTASPWWLLAQPSSIFLPLLLLESS